MKQIPILASKKETIKPRLGGVQVCCSLCAGIGKVQTCNQTYIYVMVIEEDEEHKDKHHRR